MFRLVALFAALAAPASAETFDVLLGGTRIGTMESTAALFRTTLDNTPLGVADGVSEATLAPRRTEAGAAVTQYLFRNHERAVSVLFDGAEVTGVEIDPPSEATAASDPATLAAPVSDPVTGLWRIVQGSDCPQSFRLYDGRRVTEGRVTARTETAEGTVCALDYRVVAGPGHVSPFRFRQIDIDLTYAAGTLRRIDISAGIFGVGLVRN
ncbi:hypothetical protein [Wenxinia saemankumensis]|uniref:Group 4 capsule polysaccharide lipoprotein gfcB, YjbF n=1 Tax=Wenxinia saemankumensis TaxID=1447782 RepID=A0A1M6ECQ0_9RHOB|nr:hypothetical protein [Wenxinia saemankumensis]SHI83245.1 hypothetical protein SAMN05444417_1936 [Wenxinia saemankumensis]